MQMKTRKRDWKTFWLTLFKYLGIHGFSRDVLVDWNENGRVKMPALMIRYAETEEQLKILNACLQDESTKIIKKHQPLKDEDLKDEDI